MAQIHELLPQVMADVGAIPKSRRSQAAGNYKFRSIDDVLNAVSPILSKHNVTPSFKCHDVRSETFTEEKAGNKGQRLVYRVTLLMDVVLSAPDGSSITNTAAGEGQDYGTDKATNKAMSAAYKYAMFFGLCIPVDDDEIEDSDAGKPIIRDASSVPAAPKLPSLDTAPAPMSPIIPPAPGADPSPVSAVATNAPAQATNDYSRRTDGKCYPDQIERLIAAAQQSGMPREALVAAIQKRGAAKAADLSYQQMEELIRKVEVINAEAQAPF